MTTRPNERRDAATPAAAAARETHDAARGGYGACAKSGCNCQNYEGSGGTCANAGCGHAYEDHW